MKLYLLYLLYPNRAFAEFTEATRSNPPQHFPGDWEERDSDSRAQRQVSAEAPTVNIRKDLAKMRKELPIDPISADRVFEVKFNKYVDTLESKKLTEEEEAMMSLLKDLYKKRGVIEVQRYHEWRRTYKMLMRLREDVIEAEKTEESATMWSHDARSCVRAVAPTVARSGPGSGLATIETISGSMKQAEDIALSGTSRLIAQRNLELSKIYTKMEMLKDRMAQYARYDQVVRDYERQVWALEPADRP